jgi:predicted PolB exonuclease-like 3'-5' exonuclease
MNAPILAFDIETIPDVKMLRCMHDFADEIDDTEVVQMAQRLQRQEKDSDFFPLPLHQVAVISCMLRRFDTDDEALKIFSLTAPEYDEASAIEMFFKIIEKYTPQLVSWNGGGFDLPVLNYRAMQHGIVARSYWCTRGSDAGGDKFRWNNYTSRYHERHLDLMDVLGMYQPRGWAQLDTVAQLCGLPGKIGVGGAGVWGAWQNGRQDDVRDYCENDALLTYLLYLRFQCFRGENTDVNAEEKRVRAHLQQDKERWQEFLSQWSDN